MIDGGHAFLSAPANEIASWSESGSVIGIANGTMSANRTVCLNLGAYGRVTASAVHSAISPFG